MIKMYHDLLDSVDKSKVTLVVMIDLSAAFDTIDIQMALDILQTDFGIQGTPLTYDHPNGFTYFQPGRDFINLFLFKNMAF